MIIFSVLIIFVLIDLGLNIYTNHTILFFATTQFPDLNATQGWTERGQWGDMLSGHFSALAFLAVSYTIYLQKKDLKNQEESLKNQSNLNSFKMILSLLQQMKEEAIFLTSKENVPLVEQMKTFLGTADTGGIPLHQCRCVICEEARMVMDRYW